ncbi:ATP-binding protein [Sphingomonas sp. AOB5]|uniref:sensor histidine kinase n=1 Tax=Sphingomonas sp. AOB5 TaxID=3034017 RepID=UPI0023F741BD|nr:ATP-binding protein [Sphingomonas sp. AOB5]MDF7777168.1 ATP-binding protein [Sphingomonas sp. AOB5]
MIADLIRRLRALDRQLVLTISLGLALVLATGVAAVRWTDAQARTATDAAAAQLARSNSGLLASELQKFRLLPLVLSEYPDVRAMLDAGDFAAAARINPKLELLAQRTDAAVIYVIAADGRTVASSNYRLPTSFVGQDYGFRPYFRGAMQAGVAELFALGTVSGRPGLYIARRIGSADRPLGVIVVKIEFERLQEEWGRQPGETLVTDRHGVVIITSRPAWRFQTLRPLNRAAREAIRATRQFGELPLPPLALAEEGGAIHPPGVTRDGGYRRAEAALPLDGAKLTTLYPLRPALASASGTARTITLAVLGLVALVIAGLLRQRERQLLQENARRHLESEVAARTAELRESNELLVAESAERVRANQRYRQAREELAQASRLGSLGQITAGVAHEINQPVAAIRTYAENAQRFLERESPDKARGNLERIVELTRRIGTITGELRNFARRRTPSIGPVEVAQAIDAALLLIGDSIRSAGVKLERAGASDGVKVIADRVRLEQILINLIQNALDALGGREAPRIDIAVQASAETVWIDVIDNGPGVSDELAENLFTPFVTGREQGLGLGLAIARNIAREFGGELRLIEPSKGGAAFRIELRRA